jgi:hypothetical protein
MLHLQLKWEQFLLFEVISRMAAGIRRGWFWSFVDFFVLFSGVSTASNLARTQGRPLGRRGLFLFRKPAGKAADDSPAEQ